MSVGLVLSGHEPQPHRTRLCTGPGYQQIRDWIASLPPGEYPAVRAFGEEGRFEGTDRLAAQMNDAAIAHGPPDDGTDDLVETLLGLLGSGRPGETAEVET